MADGDDDEEGSCLRLRTFFHSSAAKTFLCVRAREATKGVGFPFNTLSLYQDDSFANANTSRYCSQLCLAVEARVHVGNGWVTGGLGGEEAPSLAMMAVGGGCRR